MSATVVAPVPVADADTAPAGRFNKGNGYNFLYGR